MCRQHANYTDELNNCLLRKILSLDYRYLIHLLYPVLINFFTPK